MVVVGDKMVVTKVVVVALGTVVATGRVVTVTVGKTVVGTETNQG